MALAKSGLVEPSGGAWSPMGRGEHRSYRSLAGAPRGLWGSGPEGACHLVLEEALDGGAEGTAHEALGSGWVMEEADLQGDETVLQRQGLHDLTALPVPDVQAASVQSCMGPGRRKGSGSGQGAMGNGGPGAGREIGNGLEGPGGRWRK